MQHYLFRQLRFARENTLNQVTDVDSAQAVTIPPGFNNHITWNLGHIYLAMERFSFQLAGREMQMPPNFLEWFGTGSKPAEQNVDELPSISELSALLEEQLNRVESQLSGHLEESTTPYTTSTGLTLLTVTELLTFCLYHEGMHFDAIKSIKRIVKA